MIPVSVQGQADAEAQRLAGLATAQATKGRKKDRRDREDRGGDWTGAHAMADGAMDSMADDEDCGGDDRPLAGKTYQDRGITGGPGRYMPPGRVAAQEFGRPYEAEGHAAASPGHGPPNPMPPQAPTMPFPRHVDLTGQQALAAQIHPSAPSGPGGQR
jgi:hypothetical protein